METKKRAIACFIGGIVGMIVALIVRQAFEWLWITAGMIAGASLSYLCYDLREIWDKIPLAWKTRTRREKTPRKKIKISKQEVVILACIAIGITIGYLYNNIITHYILYPLFSVLGVLCFAIYTGIIIIGFYKAFTSLVKWIHCKGRIASAFYSALAIFITCLWTRNSATPAEYAFAVIAAGLIGAAFGSISCKVSELLGLLPAK